jgi:hypothetical protein
VANLTPEQYRAFARQCDQRAAQASDSYAKRTYEDLAAEWRKLAEQVEKHDL